MAARDAWSLKTTEIIMPNQGGTHQQHSKAGQQSHKNDDRKRQQQAEGAGREQQDEHRGGSGNFAEDRERASEAGRKGGKS
ncbi:KGG domain-containing protein [Rhizobiaceae sp. 2RAB30]